MGIVARFSWTVFAKALGLFFHLAVGAVLYRAIGADGKGTLDALVTWAALLLLASPPLEDPQLGLLGQARGRAAALFANALIASLIFGLLVTAVFGLVWCLTPEALSFHDPELGLRKPLDLRLLVLLVAASPFALATRFLGGLLQGLGDLRAFNLVSLVLPLTSFVAVIVLVVLLGLGTAGAVFAQALAVFASGLTATWLAGRHPEIQAGGKRLDWPLLATVVRRGFSLHGGFLAAWAITESDKLLLVHSRGPTELGIYSLAVALTGHLRRLFAAPAKDVFASMMPTLLGDPERFARKLAEASRQTCLLVLFPGLLLALFGPLAIRILGGPGLEAAYTPLLILIPGSLFWATAAILGLYWIGTKRFLLLTLIGVFIAGVNLFGNRLLIPQFGYLGAAWMSTGCYALHLIVFLGFLWRATGFGPAYWVLPRRTDFGVWRDTYQKVRQKLRR